VGGYMQMDTTQTHIQENYNDLFAQSVRQMEDFLRNTITDEIKNACPGVMIITLTINEYETLHRLLSESSERKIQDARREQEHARTIINSDFIYRPEIAGLTLNVIR